MTLYSYDAAYPPTLDALAKGSPLAVACYLTGNYSVASSWPAQIRSRNWGALANYEEAAGELVTAGRAGGQSVGSRAMAAALRDGFALNTSIFYSVDVNVPPSAFLAVAQAFQGINDVTKGHFCTHVYGEGALIDYLVNAGLVCAGNWLSGSASFPGFNPSSPNVALWQEIGSPVPGTDQNTITHPENMHIFWPDNSPYGGNDMPAQVSDPGIQAVLQALGVLKGDPAKFDTTHPYSEVGIFEVVQSIKTELDAVKAELDTVKTTVVNLSISSGVDPVAIAQAIAQHVQLAAK